MSTTPTPNSEIQTKLLTEKLDEIARLESEYGIYGVSFAVDEDRKIDPVDAADHVIGFIKKAHEICANLDSLPLRSDPCPDDPVIPHNNFDLK